MQTFKKILVATDTRYEEQPLISEGARLAAQNNAQLTLVDVLPDFSWPVKMRIKDHEHICDLIAAEKAKKLQELAQPLAQKGIKVETSVLRGHTSVEIIREVLRGGYDLVMKVTKGKNSREETFYGRTGKRLLRKCPCAVWLIKPDGDAVYKTIVASLDTSSEDKTDQALNSQVFRLASAISKSHGGQLFVTHAWSIWNESMLHSHMSKEDFVSLQKDAYTQAETMLNEFLKSEGSDAKHENIALLKGEPSIVIPEFLNQKQADLLVMGTVGRSGITGVVMGNTAERILDRVQCAVLAVKPAGFVCPIKLT